MAKLIILSIVLASFGVPIRYSMAARPEAALRRMLWVMFGCIVLWAWLCVHWYPTLVQIE